MDVRPLVSARPPTASRSGRPPTVPAIAVEHARAASSVEDALDVEETDGGTGAHRPRRHTHTYGPTERPSTLNLSAVYQHHTPRPPAAPVKLPEGIANPFASALDTLHPRTFERRRPASHRITRSPGTPSLAPALRPESAPRLIDRPGTGRADRRALQDSAVQLRERPETARADFRSRRPITARADNRLPTAQTDTSSAPDTHEQAADAPQTARTFSAASQQSRCDAKIWPLHVLSPRIAV
jgi:hypothetical protein